MTDTADLPAGLTGNARLFPAARLAPPSWFDARGKGADGGSGPRLCWGEGWSPGHSFCGAADIFAAGDEATGAALALALALDSRPANGAVAAPEDHRAFLWVQDRAAIRLGGRPYLPGLPRALRHRMIHVAAPRPADALFALEEGLRCRDLAFVIGEIAGNPRSVDFTASRRLVLAAERHGVPLWLVRLDARRDLGAARMRWQAAAAPSAPARWNAAAPGDPRWRAELFRARGLRPGAWWITRGDEPTDGESGDGRSQIDARPCGTAATAGDGDLVRAAGDRPLAAGARG